jgi:hypothetical protein
MTIAMQPIYTQTLANSTTSSISFNNIPQTFTDLQLLISCRTTPTGYADDAVGMSFNGDNSALYSITILAGDGSVVVSSRQSGQTSLSAFLSPTSISGNTAFGSSMGYIPNYTSNNFKSLIADAVDERNNQFTLMRLNAGLYRSTNPITSITISSSQFAIHSTFSLYGITKG